MSIEPYRRQFIGLLTDYDVIRFGDFILKSGRRSPYFIDAGELRTGEAIARLGRAYAERIAAVPLECDLVFGPSYKGIPLAVSTAMAMAARGKDVGFAFDRKEIKDHGEGGLFVGTRPKDGMRVVIVDDVITSGASVAHSMKLLRSEADVRVVAVVVAVDRQERGTGSKTTLREIEEDFGVPVLAIVTIRDIVGHLSESRLLPPESRRAVEDYIERHGAG